ncbi:MAG: hypothetical protein JNM56_09180 [Planctomycetia bacterium]|nr:hypothetical protein [Planctomycetia bacterium]
MHRKYAAQGFAAVSVALPSPGNTPAEDQAIVLKFLQSKKAGFTNLYLDETDEVWSQKLRFDGPPCIYIFNRAGKYKKIEGFDIEDGYANVEKLVVEWLKEK